MPSPDPAAPVVAVVIGDAGGVGPELVARVLADPARPRCRPLAVGDAGVLRKNVHRRGLELEIREAPTAADAEFAPGTLDVIQPPGAPLAAIPWGQVDAECGRRALAALEAAGDLARDGAVDGIVTAPVGKHALRLGGLRQIDELELLTERMSGTEPMIVGLLEDLWTACVTMHVPLAAVPGLIERRRVAATTRALASLLAHVHERPRLVVAGLNPHAGDGGVLGREEIEQIAPALADLRHEGYDVAGPVAPDTAFPFARAHGAHGVVCMYHDQANIARKLDGIRGATLFAGLPVPVATTAHGTAYDIAGTGTAETRSLRLALQQVVRLAGTAP